MLFLERTVLSRLPKNYTTVIFLMVGKKKSVLHAGRIPSPDSNYHIVGFSPKLSKCDIH